MELDNTTLNGRENDSIPEGVQQCADGKFRWAYEVNMYTNPTIFYAIANMFIIAYLICLVLFVVITLCMDEDVLMAPLVVTGIFAFIFLVTIPCYYGYAAWVGGRYAVMYTMDEQGIETRQMPQNIKKNQVIASIAGMVGAMKGDLSMMGLSMNIANTQVIKTDFKHVREVKAAPHRHLIKLSASWYDKNHIYVDEADYDFVYNYILERTGTRSQKIS